MIIITAIPTDELFYDGPGREYFKFFRVCQFVILTDQIIPVLNSCIATRAVSNIVLGKRKTDNLAGFRFCQSREKCVFDDANIFRWNIQGFINFSRIKYYGKRIIITILQDSCCKQWMYSP